MQFEPFDFDVMVHSKLGDDPNVDNNMTSDDLKARFDSPMVAFKEWINDMLVPRLNSFLPEFAVETVNGMFGKVVLAAKDILTSRNKTVQQELDERINKEDALSLEEINAATFLDGMVPSAQAAKDLQSAINDRAEKSLLAGTVGAGQTILDCIINRAPIGLTFWRTQNADDAPAEQRGNISVTMIVKGNEAGMWTGAIMFVWSGAIYNATTGSIIPDALTWTKKL